MHVRQSIRTESFANIRCRLFSPITTLSQIPKQDSDRPHTPPPVCNSLHHKVTGLRLTASATDHGLAARLHHRAGWLFQCYIGTPAYGPLCAYMTSSIKPEVHNVSQSRQSRTEPRTWATHTHTHTHPFNGPFPRTTRVSRYHKGKTNLDFTEARDNEWQWHQLGRIQVCTSLQTDNHASTPPLSFLQAGCPSCRPTNSVKSLNAQ